MDNQNQDQNKKSSIYDLLKKKKYLSRLPGFGVGLGGFFVFILVFSFIISLMGGFGGGGGGGNTSSESASLTPIPSGGPGNPDVVYWGQRINDVLDRTLCNGFISKYYNRQEADISNGKGQSAAKHPGSCNGEGGATYFCTRLVQDAWELARNKNYAWSESTYWMVLDWESRTPGFSVVRNISHVSSNEPAMRALKPGDAIFMYIPPFAYGGSKHTVLVKSVNIDSNGNGSINIIQANGWTKTSSYTVRGWALKAYFYGDASSGFIFGYGPSS